jgi:protein O-mannosyl-transferase
VLGIAALAYWPALWGPLVFDDIHLLIQRHSGRHPVMRWLGGVRPVLMSTYWLNFTISGRQTFSYHVLSLLLHVVTAWIVFLLLRRLLELAEVNLDRQMLALFGAGLFLLHPIQTESVAYIAGRSEVVAGLFYCAAWLVFVNHFGAATKFRTAIQILLLGGAAVGGKEDAISLPAILFLTDLYWNPASLLQQVRSRAKLYVPMVLGGLIIIARYLRRLSFAGPAALGTEGLTRSHYALTQCRVILTYIRLFLLPFGQNADWGLPFYRSLTDHAAWVCVLGMLALVGVIAWSYRRARLLSFGLLIFLVLLFPTSSIIPIKDAITERRMYIPIIGLILGAIWAIDRFRPRFEILRSPGALRVTAALILMAAGVLTFERSMVWSSDILLWKDSADKNPSNNRAHMGLGAAYMTHGRCRDAIPEFQTVARRGKVNDEVTINLADAYQCNHQPDLAVKELRTLQDESPSATIWDRIGYLEATMGHVTPALESFENALQLDPEDATAYSYRGTAKLGLDDLAGARADLRHALELDPRNEAALKGLASLAGQ